MRLVDWQIASLQKRHHVIEPYEDVLVRELLHAPAVPYGQARDGYILRLSATSAVSNFRVAIDPKHPPKAADTHGLLFVPPQASMMSLTVEAVTLPRGYAGRLELAPEYALCGLVLVPVEIAGGSAGARVLVTLINPMAVPVLVYHGEGIAKLVLSDEAPLPSRGEEDADAQRAGAGLKVPEGGGYGAAGA